MVIAILICTLGAFAQNPFVGKIIFETSVKGTTDQEKQTKECIVMGNCSRTKTSIDIDIITISNGNNKTYTSIMDIPGYGKYYFQVTEDERDPFTKISRNYNYTNETKTISGYTCKKVILTETDLYTNKTETTVLWVTNELGLGNDILFFEYPGLKGYPLCIERQGEIKGENYTVILTATKIVHDNTVTATQFLIPSDAKPFEEAPEELKQILYRLTDDEE